MKKSWDTYNAQPLFQIRNPQPLWVWLLTENPVNSQEKYVFTRITHRNVQSSGAAPLNRVDLPLEFWNPILISILSQKKSHRHWRHVTKKADSWDVKYLHTILLLDFEANHTYKRIVREAMRAAISNRKFAPEQYSRPQRSAVAHRINRRLVFDYQRYLWQPFW